MVSPADRSQPPPWSARLSFPAFSFPFLRSFLSSSFPSLPFLSLPPPPGHCFRAPATCTHGHCLRAPATCTVRNTVANGTCRRSPQGNAFLPPSSHSFPLRRFPFPFPFSFPPAASLAPGLPSSRNFSSLGETSPPAGERAMSRGGGRRPCAAQPWWKYTWSSGHSRKWVRGVFQHSKRCKNTIFFKEKFKAR